MTVHAMHCELCRQGVVWAVAAAFGQTRAVAFTRKPAILYYLTPGEDVLPRAVRTEPGPLLYAFHDAVCPLRPPVTSTKGTAVCSSCKRPIIWSLSPLGQRLPLDAEAVTPYRMAEEYVDLRALEVELPVEVYLSHFATCPSVASHRGKSRSRS